MASDKAAKTELLCWRLATILVATKDLHDKNKWPRYKHSVMLWSDLYIYIYIYIYENKIQIRLLGGPGTGYSWGEQVRCKEPQKHGTMGSLPLAWAPAYGKTGVIKMGLRATKVLLRKKVLISCCNRQRDGSVGTVACPFTRSRLKFYLFRIQTLFCIWLSLPGVFKRMKWSQTCKPRPSAPPCRLKLTRQDQ